METIIKPKKENIPTVAIIGRTNVGKSTLFNRLIEQKQAIVSNKAGTTRTSNEGVVWWQGEAFYLIDTGGLDFDEKDTLEEKIMKQVDTAVEQADLILFVTDGQEGVLPQEKEIAKKLQRYEKEVLLIANKIDNDKKEQMMPYQEWYSLALEEPKVVSAINGRNIGDLLDLVYKKFETLDVETKEKKERENVINVSIIGRPNAGKSTLFNKLIGEEKVIVSEQAHTTREPHDTAIVYEYKKASETKHQKINFIDTAGIRKKPKVKQGIESKGVQKSIDSIEESDIVLFVIDGSRTLSKQDKRLANLMKDRLKSVIILINKWDLAENDTPEKRKAVKDMFYNNFPHLDFAPLIFTSAMTGLKVHRIFPNIIKSWGGRHIFIQEEGLDSFLQQAIKKHPPTKGKGSKKPKLRGMKQVNKNPPIFRLFVKRGTSLDNSYLNFLANRLREQFGFFATPITIKPTKTQ